uniref:Alpha-1,3-glucosyltransferase n=1 Tax=Strongyloides venezuelensis TaxID=75913 RepID=A0A0K0G119_STRVS
MSKDNTTDVSFFKVALISTICLIAIKTCLIRSYTSTDFEVHRNWMAITFAKNLSEWYYEDTSEWTLDYPPFFAYFEWLLAQGAFKIGLKDSLKISEKPIMNDGILYYQRFTVILVDLLYYVGAFLISDISEDLPFKGGKEFTARKKYFIFFSLIYFAPLILLDNIHFQYNGFLTGLVLLSIHFVFKGNFLKSAVITAILLNFKHIYIYYVPGYVAFFLFNYLLPIDISFTKRLVLLGGSVLIPLLLSFGPFLYTTNLDGVSQILSRLFPFQRGLTHAFWAPNFWSLYNGMDFILYNLRIILARYLKNGDIIKKPEYTSGLVQEYSHTSLPNIKPYHTLTFILAFLLPLIIINRGKKRTEVKYLQSLLISSMTFFYFGYHVHEKAILLPLIPLMILSFIDFTYLSLYFNLYLVSHFTIFPLIFSPLENLTKYTLSLATTIAIQILFKITYGINLWENLNKSTKFFSIISILLEVTTNVFLPIYLPNLPFLPNIFTSCFHAMVFTWTYIVIVKDVFNESEKTTIKKKDLLEEESKLKLLLNDKLDKQINDIRIIAAVDGTYNKEDKGQVCVLGAYFYDVSTNTELDYFEEIVINTQPYIPSFFAIKEGNCTVEFMKKILSKHSGLKPDIIIVDGNGVYHKRNFGLASYISCKLNIPTIGVTKNIDLNPLDEDLDKRMIRNEIKNSPMIKNNINILPHDNRCLIIRLPNSKKLLFVSVGNGMKTEVAGKIIENLTKTGTQNMPVNVCDKRTRNTYREYFEK